MPLDWVWEQSYLRNKMELFDLSRLQVEHYSLMKRNYAPTELEALGIVWAVRHFRQYLYGHTCHVFTEGSNPNSPGDVDEHVVAAIESSDPLSSSKGGGPV